MTEQKNTNIKRAKNFEQLVEQVVTLIVLHKSNTDSVHSVDQIQDVEIIHGVYEIRNSVCPIPAAKRLHSVEPFQTPSFPPTLSWSHYLVLMRIKNPDERSFYEIECVWQMWSVRQLQRQYNSSLYERLALSKDKNEVMRLANEGHYLPDKNLLQAKLKEWIEEENTD